VIGGLSLSTLVTLFAVPTFYVAARSRKEQQATPASGAGFTPA
jgi:Cu/Ag efflux pump CusA